MARGPRALAAVAALVGSWGAFGEGEVFQPLHLPPQPPPNLTPDQLVTNRYEDPSPSLAEIIMNNRPNVRGGALSFVQTKEEDAESRSLLSLRKEQGSGKMNVAGTLDPSFWMWKTTPAPPPVPGPNPQLMWVPKTKAPDDTTPPAYENCYGCDCLLVYDLDVVQGGSIPDKYTCFGGKATVHVPKLKWAGVPENSGQGHPIRQPDGSECIKSQSFAITMQDLDYPYGTGQSQNTVRDMLWIANIPGDWTEIDDETAHATYKDKPVVVVGRNSEGTLGMETPCPKYGVHRYAFTLWALKDYIGTETSPLDPSTPIGAIYGLLEEKELARYVFYGTVAAKGYHPPSFMQMAKEFFTASR